MNPEEYRKDLDILLEQVSFDGRYELIREKVLDMYRSGIDGHLVELRSFLEPAIGSEMAGFVDRMQQDYNAVTGLINTHYKDLGVNVSRDLPAIRALEKTNVREWGAFNTETVDAMARAIRESRLAGESAAELEERLAGLKPETGNLDGRITSYAKTIARTQIKSHGQACKNQKAVLAEVFYWAYTGPPVITKGIRTTLSHVFCIELFKGDRNFHINDIRKMSNGQREPVEINRGGYRCRHDWEPNPFYNKKNYKVEFVIIPDGSRDVTIARHV